MISENLTGQDKKKLTGILETHLKELESILRKLKK